MARTRIACCQIAPRIADLAANTDLIVAAITAAVTDGAQVIVLPELATSGYMFADADEARSAAIKVAALHAFLVASTAAAPEPTAAPAQAPSAADGGAPESRAQAAKEWNRLRTPAPGPPRSTCTTTSIERAS